MAPSSFDDTITKAVEDGIIPGVVLLAANTSGSLSISRVLGSSSIAPGAEKALAPGAVSPLMSLTKLPTTVAALQLVERGRLGLDDDVTPQLPVLAAQPVLTGFDAAGAPLLEPRRHPITLRQLLTHSAGCGYDFLSPALQRYLATTTKPTPDPAAAAADDDDSVEARFGPWPLLYQPGTGWAYGTGLDWVGRLVEQTSGQDLEAYLAEHVLGPVGAVDVSFFPHRHPELAARLWGSLAARDAGGRAVHAPLPYAPAAHALGGQGLYGDVEQYFKVLVSLLRDDGRLLRPATAATLFRPQLGAGPARDALVQVTRHPDWIVGDIPDTGEYNWGLGGLLVDGAAHPWRREGAMMWSGAFNLTWVSWGGGEALLFLESVELTKRAGQILDRKAGIAAIFATLMVPPGDVKCKELMRAWEEHVYAEAAAKL